MSTRSAFYSVIGYTSAAECSSASMDNLLYNALEKYRRGIHHVFPLFVIHSAHMVGMT